jgi:hypothetical protein
VCAFVCFICNASVESAEAVGAGAGPIALTNQRKGSTSQNVSGFVLVKRAMSGLYCYGITGVINLRIEYCIVLYCIVLYCIVLSVE